MVRGHGEVVLDGVRRDVGPGDVVHVPAGMKHTVKAQEKMTIIEVQVGKEISREDKIKWEEPENRDASANEKRGGRV